MSRMLPYPGRYESHESWMCRCNEWQASRRIWNSQRGGLSGKPDKYGYKKIAVGETFAYNPGTNCDQRVLCAELIQGELKPGQYVKVVRRGYGSQYSAMTEQFARSNGLGYVRVKLGHGMTARYDGVAYDISEVRDEVYSNDEH